MNNLTNTQSQRGAAIICASFVSLPPYKHTKSCFCFTVWEKIVQPGLVITSMERLFCEELPQKNPNESWRCTNICLDESSKVCFILAGCECLLCSAGQFFSEFLETVKYILIQFWYQHKDSQEVNAKRSQVEANWRQELEPVINLGIWHPTRTKNIYLSWKKHVCRPSSLLHQTKGQSQTEHQVSLSWWNIYLKEEMFFYCSYQHHSLTKVDMPPAFWIKIQPNAAKTVWWCQRQCCFWKSSQF